mmetsp:Transcript_15392/g.36913  ORF Transcript_15392/g.36913 Transcript_15392/m.36913 type:complete len:225 (-) Transcript_15392:120-794(-)
MPNGSVGILEVGEVHALGHGYPSVDVECHAAHVEVHGNLTPRDLPAEPDLEELMLRARSHLERDDVPRDNVGKEQRADLDRDADLPLGLLAVMLRLGMARVDFEPLGFHPVEDDGNAGLAERIVRAPEVVIEQHEAQRRQVPRAARRGQRVSDLLRVVDADDVLHRVFPFRLEGLLLDGSLAHDRVVVQDLHVRIRAGSFSEHVAILRDEARGPVDGEEDAEAG